MVLVLTEVIGDLVNSQSRCLEYARPFLEGARLAIQSRAGADVRNDPG